MTHLPAAEWQAGHDAAVDALKNPTPELVERAVIAFNNVPQRLCNSDGEVAMIAALTAAAAHLFAENANKSTEQFAQNANCPDLKGQI